jgi:hypothetical protein
LVVHVWPLAAGEPASRPTDAVGCRVAGSMTIKRVTGNFHVAPPRPMFGGPFFMSAPVDVTGFNATHTIRRLSFGPHFPGQVSPLDGHFAPPLRGGAAGVAMYQYHLKVVPTLYERLGGRVLDSEQFSATDFVLPYRVRAPAAVANCRTLARFMGDTLQELGVSCPRLSTSVCRPTRAVSCTRAPGSGTTSARSWSGWWRRGTGCWR